jgi:soluble lytic murein transglycosylase-like protein
MEKILAPGRKGLSIRSMKRTFALLATMAFFAIPLPSFAKKPELKALRLEYIQSYIEEAAAKERLEPALLRAIIKVESNFNHKAVSRVGAKGLMQLMPTTAEDIGFVEALDHTNPRQNIFAGAHYLRSMINRFQGNLTLAIAAYNAGPTAVAKHKGIPPFRETQNYVVKVLGEFEREKRSNRL